MIRPGQIIPGEIVGGSNESGLFDVSIGGGFPFIKIPAAHRKDQYFSGMDCVLGFINTDSPVIISRGFKRILNLSWIPTEPEEPVFPDIPNIPWEPTDPDDIIIVPVGTVVPPGALYHGRMHIWARYWFTLCYYWATIPFPHWDREPTEVNYEHRIQIFDIPRSYDNWFRNGSKFKDGAPIDIWGPYSIRDYWVDVYIYALEGTPEFDAAWNSITNWGDSVGNAINGWWESNVGTMLSQDGVNYYDEASPLYRDKESLIATELETFSAFNVYSPV